MGDPIRVRILDALSDSPRCVCEIQSEVTIAPNLLSYHLRILRHAGLVESSRRGRWIDYQLSDEAGRLVGAALPPSIDPERPA